MRASAILLVALLGALPALAQDGPDRDKRFQEKLEAWKRMTPQQRARVKQRFEVWKKLPAGEREAIRLKLKRMGEMAPEDREALRFRLARYTNLPPEERQRCKERLGKMKEMEERRGKIVQAVGEVVHFLPPETRNAIRALPPEKKKHILQKLAGVLSGMDQEERERLVQLPPDQRRRALQRFLESRRPEVEQILSGIGPAVGPVDDPKDHRAQERKEVPAHLRRYWHSLSLEEQAQIEEGIRHVPPERRHQALLSILEERYRSDGERPPGPWKQ